DLESVEEIAVIEVGRLRQGLLGPGGHERLERGDVGVDQRFVETEQIVLLDQDLLVRRELRELLAHRRQRLAQALPRLIGTGAAPQERGDLLARHALRRLDTEIGDQGLRFLRRNREQRTRFGPDLQVSEELEPKCNHGRIRIIASSFVNGENRRNVSACRTWFRSRPPCERSSATRTGTICGSAFGASTLPTSPT